MLVQFGIEKRVALDISKIVGVVEQKYQWDYDVPTVPFEEEDEDSPKSINLKQSKVAKPYVTIFVDSSSYSRQFDTDESYDSVIEKINGPVSVPDGLM